MNSHRNYHRKMANIRLIAFVLTSVLLSALAVEDCSDAVARYHSVNASILRAIAIKNL